MIQHDQARALELLQRAMAAHRAGDIAGAGRLYAKLLQQRPNDYSALHLLGVIRAQQRRFSEADQLIARALGVQETAEAFSNHGAVLTELDRIEEAMRQLNRALRMKPAHVQAQYNLGNALRKAGQIQQAAEAFEAALRLKPDYAEAAQNLSDVLRELGRHDDAIATLQRAIARAPGHARLLSNLGIVLRDIGDIEGARAAFNRAIAADGTQIETFYKRMRTGRIGKDSALFAPLENIAARASSLPANERAMLHFVMARLREEAGLYDDSFAHLLAANQAARSLVQYDEPAALQLFDRVERIFTRDLLAERSGLGDPSTLPIFVVGFPRSGTTLTEQILASHPLVHGGGEVALMPDLVAMDLPREQSGGDFPEAVPALDGAMLHRFGSLYVERARRLGGIAAHFTDKNPGNTLFLGFVHLILPRARIIHMQRSPLDTCISCFGVRFAGNASNFVYDLGELGRRYRRYWQLMNHWRQVLPPGTMLDVEYERLVSEPETEARRIVEFCRLPWDERCLAFHEEKRVVRTASVSQVREPIYRSSVERWRRYESHLGPLIAALGPALAGPIHKA